MSGLEQVMPSALRVLAPNPGPMTLDGTNSWVLRGTDQRDCAVVDPGPLDDAHLRRLNDFGPVTTILLTHRHPDHSEGVARLRELTGATVRAADPGLCAGGGEPLVDGAEVNVAGLRLRVLATPGHSSDSVCLLLPDDRALLTGDTVLGRGTTVVAHPDGRLGDYLDSLRRLRDLVAGEVDTLLPGHGPVGQNPLQMLDFYLSHRQERLEQVAAARADLGRDASAIDIVRAVYADVDESVWPAAELSVRAQLDYLDGRSAGDPG